MEPIVSDTSFSKLKTTGFKTCPIPPPPKRKKPTVVSAPQLSPPSDMIDPCVVNNYPMVCENLIQPTVIASTAQKVVTSQPKPICDVKKKRRSNKTKQSAICSQVFDDSDSIPDLCQTDLFIEQMQAIEKKNTFGKDMKPRSGSKRLRNRRKRIGQYWRIKRY